MRLYEAARRSVAVLSPRMPASEVVDHVALRIGDDIEVGWRDSDASGPQRCNRSE